MTVLRIHLALAALLAAAAPLQAQTVPTRRFDGGAFVIDLPANMPPLRPVRLEEGGDTAEVYLSGERDGTVIVTHIHRPLPAGDTTLATRRALLQSIRGGIAYLPDRVSVSGEAREIVTDDRVTLRMPVVMHERAGPLYGTADVVVARGGAAELWMVIYVAQARGVEPDAAAARVLDTFRLTGGRSPGEDAAAISASEFILLNTPPSADSTAAARLRNTGRFTIMLPPGFHLPVASTKTQDGNLWDTFVAGTEEAMVMVLAMRPRQQPPGFQPTLPILRATARQARLEMMMGPGDTRVAGEAREIILPDRVTLRMPVANGRNGLVGTADLSVRRGERLEVWTVLYLSKERGPAADSAAARVLGSFRLTNRPRPSSAPDSRGVVDWVGGRWGWSFHAEPCDDSAATLTVAPDRKTMRTESRIVPRTSDAASVLTFRLLRAEGSYLRTALAVEGVDDSYKVWDVVRLSRDAFCWHNVNWEPSMCTAPLQRCPAGDPSAPRALLTPPGDVDPRSRGSGR